MARISIVDAASKIVELLTPLSSEERVRAVQAAMMLLGESPSPAAAPVPPAVTPEGEDVPVSARARTWMKQNSINIEELQQVFHMTEGSAEVIASHMPGKNKKEQTFNAYILTGVAQLIASGAPTFQDKSARALAESSGCYDKNNHSTYLSGHGNEFTGSKDKGWTLTAPGLKRGADIIKELNKSAK